MKGKDAGKPTLRDRLDQLRRMFPRRDGMRMYGRAKDKRYHATRRATLYTYLGSNENTHMIHETLFNKKVAMSPQEWRHFILTKALRGTGHPSEGTPAERYGIMRGAVIQGVNRRTNMQWHIAGVIGYVLHDIYGARDSALGARRHKTKSSRKSARQTHIRGRHRNRKGKTKQHSNVQRGHRVRSDRIRKRAKRAR